MPEKLTQGNLRIGYDLSKVGADLARGPNQQKHFNGAGYSDGTWPATGSTIDLDFSNNRGYVKGYGVGGVMDMVTFTRASGGRYFANNGLLVSSSVPTPPQTYEQTTSTIGTINLVTNSQSMNTATWNKTGLVVQTNPVTDPLGGTTANTIIEDGSTGAHNISATGPTLSNPGVYTWSCYCKPNDTNPDNWVLMYVYVPSGGVNGGFYFNIVTGEIGYGANGLGPNAIIPQISSAGNGWWRCAITFTTTDIANINPRIYTSKINSTTYNNPSYNGDSISGISLWGAQLEQGSISPTYRLDYSLPYTFIQNKNMVLASSNVGQAFNSTILFKPTTDTTDPVGGNTAYLANNSSWTQILQNSNRTLYTAVGNSYTFSVWMKGITGTEQVRLYFSYFSANTQTYTLSTSWQQYTLTTGGPVVVGVTVGFASGQNIGIQNMTANNFYIWGPQFELGLTPTSYYSNYHQATQLINGTRSNNAVLLIEPASTNYILWNRDATQSVWSNNSGNVITSLTQTGIDGVVNSCSLLTANVANAVIYQTTTSGVAGGSSMSAYLKLISGNGFVQMSADGNNWSSFTISNTWQRCSIQGSSPGTFTANAGIYLKLQNPGDSMAMDYAQYDYCSQSTGPTSPIYTTSAQATRAQEVFNITGAPFNTSYNPEKGTFYFNRYTYDSSGYGGGMGVAGPTQTWTIRTERSGAINSVPTQGVGGILSTNVPTSGLNVFGTGNGVLYSGSSIYSSYSGIFGMQDTSAITYDAGHWSVCNNQRSVTRLNQNTSFSIPTSYIWLGYNATGGVQTTEAVKRLIYWPYSMPDNALPLITG